MLSMVSSSPSEQHASPAAEAFRHVPTSALHNEPENEPRPRSIPVPVLVKHEEYARHQAEQSSEESSSSLQPAREMAKRPREKRSTKSKCPPGLRSGKWTPEEEAFTNLIIYYFKLGRLNVEDGTSLRWYLAKRLNCEAMRVTKKLKGNSSIGKQIFRALEDTEENRRAIEAAAEELAVVERAFLDSLAATGQPNPALASVHAATLATVASRIKRASPHKPHSGNLNPPHLEASKLVIPKIRSSLANSEDARLLMHFFVEAHDTTSDNVGVEKKRLFNEVENSSSPEEEQPETKRRTLKMEDLVRTV